MVKPTITIFEIRMEFPFPKRPSQSTSAWGSMNQMQSNAESYHPFKILNSGVDRILVLDVAIATGHGRVEKQSDLGVRWG